MGVEPILAFVAFDVAPEEGRNKEITQNSIKQEKRKERKKRYLLLVVVRLSANAVQRVGIRGLAVCADKVHVA